MSNGIYSIFLSLYFNEFYDNLTCIIGKEKNRFEEINAVLLYSKQ